MTLQTAIDAELPFLRCSGPECSNSIGPRSKTGLCRTHRAQLQRGRDLTPIQAWSRGGHWPTTCTVDRCDRPHKANGMCGAHHQRALKGSDLTAPIQQRGVFLVCSEAGCGRPHLCGGYCKRHYGALVGRFQKHGISRQCADEIYATQGGGCAICGSHYPLADLQVDHDHQCCPGGFSCGGCVRGLLCGPCNVAIGRLRDDTEVLSRAIAYLTEVRR